MAANKKAAGRVLVVAYGGGVNSTAMLVGMAERGERPDLILFADTGGERPETYDYLATISDWCERAGFPRVISVRYMMSDGRTPTLEDLCLEKSMLPSLAYGFKSCSLKHKKRPQDAFVRQWPLAIREWEAGRLVVKAIGFDAGEPRRVVWEGDGRYHYRYPLVEWGWDRGECVAAIARAGLRSPGKSSCFFCPAMKRSEILSLKRDHPDLFRRALAIEEGADLSRIKGLGRRFAWRDVSAKDNRDGYLFDPYAEDVPCECWDGDPEDAETGEVAR